MYVARACARKNWARALFVIARFCRSRVRARAYSHFLSLFPRREIIILLKRGRFPPIVARDDDGGEYVRNNSLHVKRIKRFGLYPPRGLCRNYIPAVSLPLPLSLSLSLSLSVCRITPDRVLLRGPRLTPRHNFQWV
jgi:hypothetical protein